MGLFDSLTDAVKGILGQDATNEIAAALPGALAQANLGGLQGIVTQLQASGLGTQVQSWLSNGQNMPITSDQLKAVLSSDQVKQIAEHFGVDPNIALNLLAQHLPTAVDQASPNGTLPANS